MRRTQPLLAVRPSLLIPSHQRQYLPAARNWRQAASQKIYQRRSSPARPFSNPPWQPEVQTLHASRTLSYPSTALYNVIADVQSYSAFLPYCLESRVTNWSEADSNGKQWPREAELRVGWSGYEEKFVSRVYCVPGSVVEAVSGAANTTISSADLPHYTSSAPSPTSTSDSLFNQLLTTWTLRPFPYKPPPKGEVSPQEGQATEPAKEQTEVNLAIEFQFANPVYATLSKAVAPKIASMMIEAFEKRASRVLGGSGMQDNVGALEGNVSAREMQQP